MTKNSTSIQIVNLTQSRLKRVLGSAAASQFRENHQGLILCASCILQHIIENNNCIQTIDRTPWRTINSEYRKPFSLYTDGTYAFIVLHRLT